MLCGERMEYPQDVPLPPGPVSGTEFQEWFARFQNPASLPQRWRLNPRTSQMEETPDHYCRDEGE